MSHGPRVAKYPEGHSGVFDTHAHLYDDKCDSPEEELRRASSCGVDTVLIPADNVATSRLAVEYAQRWNGYEGVTLYASVGVHPHEASSYDEDAETFIIDMIGKRQELRIKAIGEIGLDYYYDHSPRDVQREVFAKQLELSFEYDIPFILHERDAAGDCLDILNSFRRRGRFLETPGVCHCCSCSAEVASELIRMGFYIGFDGPLTFKNNKKTPKVCEICPMDRIVVETDSPYLTPEPNRGMTNEPAFVPYVVEKIAQIKGMEPRAVADITKKNGEKLFRI
ncbi:MAG: TatD family hydrolase [Clostridiales bacterium]|nr:TatD family hydrolase [Clostridiales bacterium]